MRKYSMKTTLPVQQLIKMWLFGSIQSIYKSFDAPERIQTKVLAQSIPDTLPKNCYKDFLWYIFRKIVHILET